MNSDILKGKWKQLMGSARRKWGEMTDDDLNQVQGDGETLIGKLQEKYGKSRDWAEREVNDFLRDSSDVDQPAESGQGDEFSGTRRPEDGRKRRVS